MHSVIYNNSNVLNHNSIIINNNIIIRMEGIGTKDIIEAKKDNHADVIADGR
jgi:hypothetical protein